MPGGDLDIPFQTRQHVRFRAPCELLGLFRASASASSIANEGRRRGLEAHAAFWARIRISLSCTQGQSASLSHLRNPGFAESRLWITRGIDSETASSSLSWSERGSLAASGIAAGPLSHEDLALLLAIILIRPEVGMGEVLIAFRSHRIQPCMGEL